MRLILKPHGSKRELLLLLICSAYIVLLSFCLFRFVSVPEDIHLCNVNSSHRVGRGVYTENTANLHTSQQWMIATTPTVMYCETSTQRCFGQSTFRLFQRCKITRHRYLGLVC
jgi:hypothetical protein